MLFVVAYDVSDDASRLRIAQLLLRVGERVQESVFECRTTRARLDRTLAQCGKWLGRDPQAQMRVYELCAACESRAFGVGAVRPSRSAKGSLIV